MFSFFVIRVCPSSVTLSLQLLYHSEDSIRVVFASNKMVPELRILSRDKVLLEIADDLSNRRK